MAQPWRSGKVIRIENETPATRRFWIEVPELPSFDFTPGQFVTLDLPIHEKTKQTMAQLFHCQLARWQQYFLNWL
jgi:ferredoxin-NADP reductase